MAQTPKDPLAATPTLPWSAPRQGTCAYCTKAAMVRGAPPLAPDPAAEAAVAAARDQRLASEGEVAARDCASDGSDSSKWNDSDFEGNRHGIVFEDRYCGPPGGPYDPARGNTERFDPGLASLQEIREHWARRIAAARGQTSGGPSTAAAPAASSGPSEPAVAAARDRGFPADGADIPVDLEEAVDPEEAARAMNAAAAAAKEALDKLVAERGGVENLLLMLLEEPLPRFGCCGPTPWKSASFSSGAGSRLQGVRRRHGGPAPGDGPALQPGDGDGARAGPAGSAGDGREPRPG